MCKNIDQPFYFHTNDAIFLNSNPEFDSDTMVLSNENFDPLNYRSVTIDVSTNLVLKSMIKILNLLTILLTTQELLSSKTIVILKIF